jgi:hypothetical protein
MAINASAWWPDVSDLQKAQKATRYGFWVAVIVATVTAISASLALYLHTSILGVDATGLVDVVLFAAIAFGIDRKSRVAAVAGLVLYVTESAYMLAAGSRSSSSLVLTAIFTLYLVHGVRGTFAYRKLSTLAATASAPPAEVTALAASPLAKDSRKAGEDFLVAGCGLLTSFVTALILWFVEKQFGFALYTWMFWFVIPVGALFSGFAGASGYYAGSWFFGHRPTRLLLLNIVVASVATFFLIHYLSYITLQIDGKQVSDYIPFWRYIDIAIRSTSMDFRLRATEIGKTGELGSFGYAIAFLQVLGFAAVGLRGL